VRPPRRAEQQQHADFRRRRGDRIGCGQHRYAAFLGGGKIDMVGTDRQGEDRLHAFG